MPINIDIPKLNDCRARLGWSQAKLAKAADICSKTVSRIYLEGKASDKTHAAILRAIQLGLEEIDDPNIPVTLKLNDRRRRSPDGGLAIGTITLSVTFKFWIDLEDLTQDLFDELQDKIREVIGRTPDPDGFEEGCSKITYLLSRKEFEQLRIAFKKGVFGDAVSEVEVSRQVGRQGVVNPRSDLSLIHI